MARTAQRSSFDGNGGRPSLDFPGGYSSYGPKQEFITTHCPQQNTMIECVTRTLKEQCVRRHRFESQTHALRVIGDWTGSTTGNGRIRR